MASSAEKFIANNDFEGAFNKFSASTARWRKHWFDTCYSIAVKCREWFEKFCFDVSTLFIAPKSKENKSNQTITTGRNSAYSIDSNAVDMLSNAHEKCYLFRFFDEDGNRLCSKVGTTTRNVMTRLREELRSKTYTSMGAVHAVVDRVYNCDPFEAEGLESFFRAEYIKTYPGTFKKNDRFIGVDFDLDRADEIYRTYMALS